MAAKNERVMQMVKMEVEKNPSVPSRELFDKAKAMDSGMSDLTLQQFHAGYPLQVKRRLKLSALRDAGASAPPARRRPDRPPQVRATAAAKAGPVPRDVGARARRRPVKDQRRPRRVAAATPFARS